VTITDDEDGEKKRRRKKRRRKNFTPAELEYRKQRAVDVAECRERKAKARHCYSVEGDDQTLEALKRLKKLKVSEYGDPRAIRRALSAVLPRALEARLREHVREEARKKLTQLHTPPDDDDTLRE
jgi:hypothetical protein